MRNEWKDGFFNIEKSETYFDTHKKIAKNLCSMNKITPDTIVFFQYQTLFFKSRLISSNLTMPFVKRDQSCLYLLKN